ncbi:MAG: hypothetical protein ATN36_06685 [Epulopiscium sp. Nele67-Bin005]|nr:MAG: hypothetical protein ATN36_06685 [Epulopiscium sp. Nele67-Bin005]
MKKKTITLDVEMAFEIGLKQAIMLAEIQKWVGYNKSQHKNFQEGEYWVYNTASAWAKLVPVGGVQTIRKVLADLEQLGLIKSGNFNKFGADKTKWYTIVDNENHNTDGTENIIPSNENHNTDGTENITPSNENHNTDVIKNITPSNENHNTDVIKNITPIPLLNQTKTTLVNQTKTTKEDVVNVGEYKKAQIMCEEIWRDLARLDDVKIIMDCLEVHGEQSTRDAMELSKSSNIKQKAKYARGILLNKSEANKGANYEKTSRTNGRNINSTPAYTVSTGELLQRQLLSAGEIKELECDF